MPKEKRRRNKRRRMPRKFKRPRSSSGSSSDRKQQRRVDAVISQAAPIIATTAILASQGHFSEAGSSSGPQPSTSGATSSSASNVPMVCPKPALMNCLQKVGARGTCFTRKEVLKYLIQYIGERMLYDQSNPRVVYCREDELGKALGVPQFTIYNVKDVLAANCVPVTSPQVIQADTQTSASQAKVHYTLQHSVAEGREPAARPKSAQAECQDAAMPGPSTVPQKAKEKRKHRRRNKLSESEKSTSSTGSSTRRRRHSSSLSIGQTLQLDEEGPKGLPWFYFVKCPKESEKRSSGSCTERWSIDGYSTAYVADSSDDLWFLEEDSDREEVIDWEFELDSDSSEPYNDDDDEEDSIDGEEEEYYVEMIQCSDNDSCMADESEESTDEEITDKDKWKCDVCPMRNHPCQRFCSHCWALRKDWFPEVHNSSQKSTLQRSNSCPEAQSMENADTSGAMDPSPSVVSPPERTISTDSAFSSLGSSSQEVNSSAPGAAGVSQDHVGAVVMEPCMICLSRPKVASMVHGRTAHLVCCYTCAKKLYKRGKPCPVCRRPIQMVVKTFFA